MIARLTKAAGAALLISTALAGGVWAQAITIAIGSEPSTLDP